MDMTVDLHIDLHRHGHVCAICILYVHDAHAKAF